MDQQLRDASDGISKALSERDVAKTSSSIRDWVRVAKEQSKIDDGQRVIVKTIRLAAG